MDPRFPNPYGSGIPQQQRFGGLPQGQDQRSYRQQHPSFHPQQSAQRMRGPSPSFRSNYPNHQQQQGWENSANYTPHYTPTPRHRFPQHGSPGGEYRQGNNSYGNRHGNSSPGRGNWRGRGRGGGPRFDAAEKAPIEHYFSQQMLKDPWEGLKPYKMEVGQFTTT